MSTSHVLPLLICSEMILRPRGTAWHPKPARSILSICRPNNAVGVHHEQPCQKHCRSGCCANDLSVLLPFATCNTGLHRRPACGLVPIDDRCKTTERAPPTTPTSGQLAAGLSMSVCLEICCCGRISSTLLILYSASGTVRIMFSRSAHPCQCLQPLTTTRQAHTYKAYGLYQHIVLVSDTTRCTLR